MSETKQKLGTNVKPTTKIKKVTCKGFKSFQRKTSTPFYDGLTAVVGENGSGKCVTGDTEVLLSDGSREKISNIVENAVEKSCEEIDDGYISYEGDHKVLSINQETFETEEREVLAYAKREAPDKILEIETRSGRKITATEDHPLFILKEGELEAVDAEELFKGQRIAVPREVNIKPNETKFNEIKTHISAEDNLYVPYNKEIEEIIRKTKQKESLTWKELAEKTETPYNVFKGIRDQQSSNLAYTVKILQYCEKEDEIPELINTATSKKSSKEFKIPWNNSHEFSRLLGYLLAEGKVTESNQIWFTNSNKKIIRNYEELFKSVFGIETDRKKYNDNCWDVLAYSSGVCTLLEKFGVSKEGSGEKEIPDLFLKNANKKQIGGLLEGLYAGDGYVSNGSIEITLKSSQLINDLQQALLRLGVNSRIQEIEKTATNTGATNTYYQLNITGAENIKKLKENMTIPHTMKRDRMLKLSEKVSNTNIDLITANGLVKKAVEKNNIKPHSRKNRKELSVLGAYYSEKSLTSRKGLKKILEKYGDKEDESLNKLERLAKSDIYWDEITSIKEKEPENDWVYDLNVSVNHNFIANNTFVHNSNILDAISFVFGRRSSRLRAKKLEQLIFNGGDSRKPAEYAQVTIYLDNSAGIFDEFLEEDEKETDEITVGRKITRAGSSMYKFQGTNCKRGKIDEIAKKANIDPSGYHFVRQGKVTEIVEQSGIERRKVIDELSGITHFEEQKEEALEELEEVEETLKEQEIILNEKKEHLDKLKQEKELALQYRELEERKKKLEASILEVRKRALSNQLANINTGVSEQRERVEELEEELEELDEEIDSKQDRIDEIDDKQSQGNTDIQHLTNKIEKKEGKIENKREKKKDLQETLESLKKMQQNANTGSKAVDAVISLNNDKIHGAFQDLISIDKRYATAIDTAAGGSMKDVVVEDKNTALEAINYLKRENIGRARMLPLDKIRTGQRSAKSKIAKKKKGVIDYAAELVDYNPQFEKAINYVFRDTLVAEDLDSVKNIDGVRVVTLDGDIMSKGGAMTGGKKKRKRRRSKSKTSKRLNPEKKKEEIKKVDKEIESLQKDIIELKRMKEKREDESETNEELMNEKKQIRSDLKSLRSERQEFYSEKQRLKTKIDQVGGKKANLKAELQNVEQDMEEYQFNTDELIGLDSSPEDLKSKKKKILRKQNSMGPINMRAIEEYKKKKEEYDEFKNKVSEIRQEKLEIEDMLEEIEQKKREKFMETLTQIQESFTRIFEQLFGGGTGELVLEDDDINKGLDIKAQPPGKEPHIITSLSGGEKTMTAIAFVFAILEYEESPFYIMDEIDAALDKSNSKKLSELLKEYAGGSQFIVISHNDITVRHAERAYGISMRDGVSKVRSIDLEL